MENDSEIRVVKPRSFGRWLFWALFFGLIFVFVYFPLFGSDWRFKLGSLFEQAFEFIGSGCAFTGVLLMIWGFFSLICGNKNGGVKIMVIGFLLFLIGGYVLNPARIYVGTHGNSIPQGYQ